MNSFRINVDQNYLRDDSLVRKLVAGAAFSSSDIVLDIGAGKGIITAELIKYAKKVIAIELDKFLFKPLTQNFADYQVDRVELVNQDFMDYELPKQKFSVFSNIPFNMTADILRKLLMPFSLMERGYIIVQREACEKFAGEQVDCKNTMLSIMYGVTYELSIVHFFEKYDFIPMPSVEIVLMKLEKRQVPLIADEFLNDFIDFVAYVFNKSNPSILQTKLFTKPQILRLKKDLGINNLTKPSEVSLSSFVQIFKVLSLSNQLKVTHGYYGKILSEQRKIAKIHRTRVDASWKEKV